MKKYIAYGSNLHKEQMSFRCPGAKVLYTGIIENYVLVYRGSKTGAYATIIPCEGEYVPVAVWEINEDHETSLDIYEGFPRFYHKEDLEVTLKDGRKISAMAYIMCEYAKPGYPSMKYLETCGQGYLDCDLDMTKFEESIIRNQAEVRQAAYRSYRKA